MQWHTEYTDITDKNKISLILVIRVPIFLRSKSLNESANPKVFSTSRLLQILYFHLSAK